MIGNMILRKYHRKSLLVTVIYDIRTTEPGHFPPGLSREVPGGAMTWLQNMGGNVWCFSRSQLGDLFYWFIGSFQRFQGLIMIYIMIYDEVNLGMCLNDLNRIRGQRFQGFRTNGSNHFWAPQKSQKIGVYRPLGPPILAELGIEKIGQGPRDVERAGGRSSPIFWEMDLEILTMCRNCWVHLM